MKTILTAALTIILTTCSFSQDTRTIDKKLVCEPPKKLFGNIEPVGGFKDNLNLKIQVDKITLGTEVTVANKSFVEVIRNESSIFEITKESAISVSIGRVTENGSNFYIYKIHLFRKVKDCWEDSAWDTHYTKCKPGTITSGYGYGNEGTSGFIGFSGSVTIE
jgi:hypothetical protein